MARNILEDIFGPKKSKKQIKRETIAQNRERGATGEQMARLGAAMEDITYERTGRGSDFKAYRTDPLTGKKKFIGYREIKTGNAKLSRLQKKTKKKKRNYKVVRMGSIFD